MAPLPAQRRQEREAAARGPRRRDARRLVRTRARARPLRGDKRPPPRGFGGKGDPLSSSQAEPQTGAPRKSTQRILRKRSGSDMGGAAREKSAAAGDRRSAPGSDPPPRRHRRKTERDFFAARRADEIGFLARERGEIAGGARESRTWRRIQSALPLYPWKGRARLGESTAPFAKGAASGNGVGLRRRSAG